VERFEQIPNGLDFSQMAWENVLKGSVGRKKGTFLFSAETQPSGRQPSSEAEQ
jgi:hypothetical protein